MKTILRKIYFFFRSLSWLWSWLWSGRCFKCGIKKIPWGYMSGTMHCPLCDMKLHENKLYQNIYPERIKRWLNEYRKNWGKDYESKNER